ncbi:hypothetical protein [Corynebacterium aquilae]|uniref:hypothetical protein n=1 Tax=Corynebacterium aquilae TaxID=203263 RepID=UPI0012EEDA61|nr:hypothetical protein [Corynebacterium aquilae]
MDISPLVWWNILALALAQATLVFILLSSLTASAASLLTYPAFAKEPTVRTSSRSNSSAKQVAFLLLSVTIALLFEQDPDADHSNLRLLTSWLLVAPLCWFILELGWTAIDQIHKSATCLYSSSRMFFSPAGIIFHILATTIFSSTPLIIPFYYKAGAFNSCEALSIPYSELNLLIDPKPFFIYIFLFAIIPLLLTHLFKKAYQLTSAFAPSSKSSEKFPSNSFIEQVIEFAQYFKPFLIVYDVMCLTIIFGTTFETYSGMSKMQSILYILFTFGLIACTIRITLLSHRLLITYLHSKRIINNFI